MAHKQCPFVWHDLLTHNVKAAKRFYAKVLGWTYMLQDEDYHVTMVSDHGVGGIMQAPEYLQKMPPFWSAYILSHDADKTCKRASDLGGIIFRAPWDIPGVMRMAVIADPTGGIFNILQPLGDRDEAPLAAGTQGTVAWHELYTVDLDLAWDFYVKLFGWSKGDIFDMGEAGRYQTFKVGGSPAGAMLLKQHKLPRPMWLNYFSVKSIKAATARVQKAGGTIVSEAQKLPTGLWTVFGEDPQGGHFQLASLNP